MCEMRIIDQTPMMPRVATSRAISKACDGHLKLMTTPIAPKAAVARMAA